jgi:hypothetical protein
LWPHRHQTARDLAELTRSRELHTMSRMKQVLLATGEIIL